MAGAPTPDSTALLPADAYLPTRTQWLAGMVLALSNFMVVLDLTIANVSVPHIAGNLGITLDQGTWIITSYAVAEAICVPLTGWLAQRFGTVRVFLFAMLGFGLFSLLCGMSVTLDMLVICRIGQGLCGAPMMPMSQTLLTRVFPPEKRGVAMAMWAMTVLLGPAFGPIIGGTITDNWSWHWIFLINVPIALIAAAGGFAMLRRLETPVFKLPIDRVGLFMLIFWIGSLQVMLDIGRDHDWFADWRIVLLAVGAVVGFLAFLIWELTEEHPIVDLWVFRHRAYWTSVLTFSLCFGAYFSGVVVIPQWLQVSLGYTAMQSGLVTASTALAAVIASQMVVRLLPKVDTRILVTGAVIWMMACTYARSWWFSGADFWTILLPVFAQGFAMPFLMMPLTNATMSAVLPEEMASGAGLQNFTRTLAVAVATSIVLTIWGDHQRIARVEIVSRMDSTSALAKLTATGLSPEQAQVMLGNLIDREAITVAIDYVFMVSTIVLAIAGAVMWLSPRITLTRLTSGPPAH
ncbi:MAG: DHA2 family efflux MFS transporter permease subunit [Sphingomonadales bacterium]|nr:DHA2 family efflux MFS transporter permease subunit [Sphingomonadales bacterium]